MKKLLSLCVLLLPLVCMGRVTLDSMATVYKTAAYFDGDFEQWVDQQVTFPSEAMAMGIAGVIEVSFVVNTQGKVEWIQPAGNVSNTWLFLELKRVLQQSPAWNPAINLKNKPCHTKIGFRYDFTQKLDSAALESITIAHVASEPKFGNREPLDRFCAYIEQNYEVPKEFKKRDYEYKITLGFTIDKEKKPAGIIVKGCDNPGIEKSVIALIEKSKWSEALINGKPAEYYIQTDMVLAGNKKGKVEDISRIERRIPDYPDGGISGFMQWVVDNSGSTPGGMKFIINADGSISDIVVKGNDKALENLLRKSLPWVPAVWLGERVSAPFPFPGMGRVQITTIRRVQSTGSMREERPSSFPRF